MERYLWPLTDDEREAFIAAAKSYLHVRWRHQGRSGRGVDCAGLLICAMRDIGREPLDAEGYGKVPYRGKLQEMLRINLGAPVARKPIAMDMLRFGDMALMQFKGDPSHLGVIVPHPQGGMAMLHAFAQNREVTWHRIDEQWLGYIAEVYRP